MDIIYDGGMRFTIHERGHDIAVDMPLAAGGTDTGLLPTELLSGALGSCIGYYVLAYFRKNNLDPTGLRIEIAHEMTEERPRRVSRITTCVYLPTDVSEEHWPGIKSYADRCTIHNSLLQPMELPVEICREVTE